MPAERPGSSYCCPGCEVVHGLLASEGLLRFYELGGGATGAVGPAPRATTCDWLPEREAASTHGGLVRMTLDVQNMRCAACVWLLQAIWRRIPGGRSLLVSPSLGQATLTYDQGSGAGAEFVRRAGSFGYPMAPPSREARRDTGLLVRLGICVAIAMNAMILAVSLYFGLDVAAADGALRVLFGHLLLGLGTASVVVGGPVFFRAAWSGLRVGVVHMDLPISLGLLAAWAGSVHGHFTGGATWFDTVSIFTAFMLGGRFLQQRTLARGRDQVLADDGVEHLRARRLEAGVVQLVPVRDLRAGDRLLLAPGDLVPVRAAVLGEAGAFSLDWISGESEPREFAVGAEVPAGAFHAGRRAVAMEVRADYLASGLAQLLAEEPPARDDPNARVRFWHLVNRNYAVGVLLASLLGGLLWWYLDPSKALPVAVSVLVITCPCAMGIATPLAFHLALAALRRRGVFVRARDLLERVRSVRKVVFDKTGTVTFGGLRARAIDDVPEAALPALATMAASSNHPVSQAVLQALPRTPFVVDLHVDETVGSGLACDHDGAHWRLGSRAFASGIGGEDDVGDRRECVLSRDGRVVATFALEEDFRAGATGEIETLRRRGLAVHLLSGDRPDRVQRAAARLGIVPELARGGMSPEDKAAAVRELDARDTMMVGDGLNDAPAFAAAFCAGTPAMDRPVLPARADFFFRGAQAGAVASLFAVADRHAVVVRTNLALAVAYNTGALGLCFAAAMTPGLCAVLMPLSSLALVLHTSMRMSARRQA